MSLKKLYRSLISEVGISGIIVRAALAGECMVPARVTMNFELGVVFQRGHDPFLRRLGRELIVFCDVQ
jgi:hypothetical protein